RLYSSGEYSDLVISCRGKEYHVHKAIVCTQSEFFSTACRTSFKASEKGKIDLPDDDPQLVHIMIYYLYHFDYDIQLAHEQSHSEGSGPDVDRRDMNKPTGSVLATHARVYSLAEKYLIRGLKTVAVRQFKLAATSFPDIDDFLEATLEVYSSTVDDDRGLRDVVVETLYTNSNWLDRENVRDVIKELGALTYDLVIYMRRRRAF
ncbi:hypothetical protein MYCTH_2050467, partial [Thermothelomyces thermophilus ATCC 42464]